MYCGMKSDKNNNPKEFYKMLFSLSRGVKKISKTQHIVAIKPQNPIYSITSLCYYYLLMLDARQDTRILIALSMSDFVIINGGRNLKTFS